MRLSGREFGKSGTRDDWCGGEAVPERVWLAGWRQVGCQPVLTDRLN